MNMKIYLHGAATILVVAFLSGCLTVHTEGATQPRGVGQAQSNKDFVVEFYQRVLIDGDVDAADRYLRADYIQHNPKVPTGLDGFKAYFKKLGKQLEVTNSKLHGEIEHVVVEGDLVVIFVSYRIEGLMNLRFQAADLFRVQDGLIAEHWDVLQGATLRDHTILMQN